MIRRSSRAGVRPGLLTGREDRSVNGSPARYLPAHFDAVAGETWNRFGGPAYRPALIDDQPRQTQTAKRSEWGISVSHEDLRSEGWCGNPLRIGGPHLLSSRRAVHNVPRNYN